MGKVLRCKDVGMDCDFVARADSEEELLKKAAEHAAKTHNMKVDPGGGSFKSPRSHSQ